MTEYDPYFEEDDPLMDEYEEEENYEDCVGCGPWCSEWGGDGPCIIAIEDQNRQREEYMKRHTRSSRYPICGAKLTEYDVYAKEAEPWMWSAGSYDPMIAVMDAMGPLRLNKGILHSQGRVHQVWIEWDSGREDRLLPYLEANPLEVTAR